MKDVYKHCLDYVKRHDQDRYLASLFAPSWSRPYLWALYAFNIEIASVRERVTDPLPGEMRLEWWREVLQGEGRGDVAGNPIALALIDTVTTFKLSRAALLRLIEARVGDLYDDPIETHQDWETYAHETSSVLMHLACHVVGKGQPTGTAEAASFAGVAYAGCGLLRALPYHARQGRVMLPRDKMKAHSVTREMVLSGETTPQLRALLRDLREGISLRLDCVAQCRPYIRACAAGALLPVAVVNGYMNAMEKPGYDPYHHRADLTPLAKLKRFWTASRCMKQDNRRLNATSPAPQPLWDAVPLPDQSPA